MPWKVCQLGQRQMNKGKQVTERHRNLIGVLSLHVKLVRIHILHLNAGPSSNCLMKRSIR